MHGFNLRLMDNANQLNKEEPSPPIPYLLVISQLRPRYPSISGLEAMDVKEGMTLMSWRKAIRAKWASEFLRQSKMSFCPKVLQ